MTDPRSSGGSTKSGTNAQTGAAAYTSGGEALTPERRARLAYEAFNDRDLDMTLDQNRDDVEIVDQATGERFQGREGALRFLRNWLNAFPDAHCNVKNVITGGDTVVVEFQAEGTNTGPIATPHGTLPATGRRASLPMCDVLEFSGGKVARQRTYYDVGTLLGQLGVQR